MAKTVSASRYWTVSMFELPGVGEDGMPGRNVQRKPGTARGSPRRSRTAKASRISRHAVKSRCACEWGGWGRLSDDDRDRTTRTRARAPGVGGVFHRMAVHDRVLRPDSARTTVATTKCTKGGCKLDGGRRMPGAGLNRRSSRKAPLGKPAFQPDWGKPAVRMIGRIEETSASFEARSAPRSYPTPINRHPTKAPMVRSIYARGLPTARWVSTPSGLISIGSDLFCNP